MKRSLAALSLAALMAATMTACAGGSTSDSSDGAQGDSVETSAEELTEYPVDKITMIVPFAAGSGPDGSARVIAQEMESILDVTIVVENVEGGQALTGLYQVASSPTDGSVIGWGGEGAITINPWLVDDSPFEGPETLAAVGRAKSTVNVLFASPSHGWNTIEDFVAEAKERPGELKVGLPAAGSSQSLQFMTVVREAGIDVQIINYGAGEMILPAVNGTVDAAVAQAAPVVQYVEAGQLQWVAALGGTVLESLDAQPVEDFGYDTTEIPGWEGVVAPAGIDEAARSMLEDALEEAVESDAYQEYCDTTFSLADFLPGDELQELMEAAYVNGESVVEEFGLKN